MKRKNKKKNKLLNENRLLIIFLINILLVLNIIGQNGEEELVGFNFFTISPGLGEEESQTTPLKIISVASSPELPSVEVEIKKKSIGWEGLARMVVCLPDEDGQGLEESKTIHHLCSKFHLSSVVGNGSCGVLSCATGSACCLLGNVKCAIPLLLLGSATGLTASISAVLGGCHSTLKQVLDEE